MSENSTPLPPWQNAVPTRRERWKVSGAAIPFLAVGAFAVVILGVWLGAEIISAHSPKADFERHRAGFDEAVEWVYANGSTYEYALDLPPKYSHLAEDGFVSVQGTTVFFPMWLGIPDDAGGYVYAPDGDPYGIDLYGSTCQNIKDLGDDWWSCSMR